MDRAEASIEGCGVMGDVRRLTIGLVVLGFMAGVANADELIMPYTCTMNNGGPRLESARDTVYEIIGTRDQMPFSYCKAVSGADCETMMIHKFSISCSGQRVSWARVAAAGRELGIDLPSFLPKGYAPVSKLSARFILPSLSALTHQASAVSTQDLVPFATVETASLSHAQPATATPAEWITVVDAARANSGPRSHHLRTYGSVSALVLLLLIAGLAAARRWSYALIRDAAGGVTIARSLDHISKFLASAWSLMTSGLGESFRSWWGAHGSEWNDGDYYIENTLSLLFSRLVEVEDLVSRLPASLLLRDVLTSELDQLRERGANLRRQSRRVGIERVRSTVRAVLRELDRIARIAGGAAEQSTFDQTSEKGAVPQTPADAYRALGLNSTAPPAAIKKVVDALRMTWHPDLAADEYDRRLREERIKQINAAWDLLKDVRRAA